VEQALDIRELLKVRVHETSPEDARTIGASLAGRIEGAHLIQVIGRTVVLYRRHPEMPEIQLPT